MVRGIGSFRRPHAYDSEGIGSLPHCRDVVQSSSLSLLFLSRIEIAVGVPDCRCGWRGQGGRREGRGL